MSPASSFARHAVVANPRAALEDVDDALEAPIAALRGRMSDCRAAMVDCGGGAVLQSNDGAVSVARLSFTFQCRLR